MLLRRGLLCVLVLCPGSATRLAADSAKPTGAERWQAAGPQTVATMSFDWTDTARHRDVPVKIYYPKSGDRRPIIIMSHGLVGTRDGYEYLGRHWASHGYVSVHPQHKGSDDTVWKNASNRIEAMQKAAGALGNATQRPKDVSFVIDRLEKLNGEAGPLRGRLNLNCIGMAGHSFGANTTLLIVGQTAGGLLGAGLNWADPRVHAAIPMSAPVPKSRGSLDQAFGSIKIPCLHMTGTLDDSPVGETKAAERRIPFDHIRLADQYLVTFNGGDHMIFSGRPRRTETQVAPGWQGGGANDAVFQQLIRTVTVAFWDAYLRGDAQAKAWLSGGGCESHLGANAKFEKKLNY